MLQMTVPMVTPVVNHTWSMSHQERLSATTSSNMSWTSKLLWGYEAMRLKHDQTWLLLISLWRCFDVRSKGVLGSISPNHIRPQPPVPRYIMPKILWIGETWNEWSELAACQIKASSSCGTTVTVICRNIRSWIQDCRDHIWPVPVWESLRQRSQIWVNPPVVLVLLALGCHCWWYYPPNPDKHRNPKTLKQGALDLLPRWEFQEEPFVASLSIAKCMRSKQFRKGEKQIRYQRWLGIIESCSWLLGQLPIACPLKDGFNTQNSRWNYKFGS